MKIIDIPQGSELWHAHRAQHWNASDAPAMMGCSPYKSRSDFLRERATGVAADVSPEQQARFDDGHRYEALARPLAEALLGDDLYPLTKVNSKMSASLDGQDLLGEIDWEHKTLNDTLRKVMPADGVGGPEVGAALPLMYLVQVAHQQHCSGAKKTLFTASKWGHGDQLIEARHCWIARDDALIGRVLAGWAQFDDDLQGYTATDAAPAVVAAAAPSLPAVSVRMDGQLAVVSNLPAFGVALRDFIARIPERPSTDQEFADTDAACKALKRAEEALEAAEAGALASIGDVEAMRRLVADFRDLARTTRLAREKAVTARKDQIKAEQVQRGRDALAQHIAALNRRLHPSMNYMPAVAADFGVAIKGLRTVDSVRNAIDTALADAKIEASGAADKIDANLKTIAATGTALQWLFADVATLAHKDTDAVKAIVSQRVAEHHAAEEKRMEAERARIRAEEAARLEREAAQRAESERLERLAEERRQQLARNTEGPTGQQVLKAEPATADATDRGTPDNVSPHGGAMGAGQAAAAAPAGERWTDEDPDAATKLPRADLQEEPRRTIAVELDHAPPATLLRQPEPATIKLGDLCTWAGFTLTRTFIESLGIKPTLDGARVLFTATQKRELRAALLAHVEGLQA